LFFCVLVCSAFAGNLQRLRAKAEKGDLQAMFLLGDEFFYGSEKTPRNPTLAVFWYQKAAAGGLPEAMFNYGVCLDQGIGIPQNHFAAYEWYKKAAEKGSLHAKFNMVDMLLYGVAPDEQKKHSGIPSSPELALHYLKELKEQKFEPAEIRFAELLLEYRRSPEEIAEAAEILQRLSGKSTPSPKVLRLLADCKYAGLGMKPDLREMLRLLEKSVELGDAESAGKLAFCYEYGRGTPADEKKAFDFYKLGAERGNAMSQFKYAEFLSSGRAGQEPDIDLAITWYREAVKNGNPQAIFRMGVFYLDGMGSIVKDPAKAAEYFYLAAQKGYAQAQYNLACMFSAGEGGLIKDEAAALFWFLQAAKQGDAASARNIGLRYVEGEGVARSITKAELWLRKAAESGDHEAERILKYRFR
jgi:TPR repeat protein